MVTVSTTNSSVLTGSGEALLCDAHRTARRYLVRRMRPEGWWEGRLSSSALATAMAISALAVAAPGRCGNLRRRGLRWLRRDQNPDGGWGDTPDSPSNTATTVLAEAAFILSAASAERELHPAVEGAEAYLDRHAGGTAEARIECIRGLYGRDRTFAVPILATCALAGEHAEAPPAMRIPWSEVPRLPFELGCLPHWTFSRLRLHVVSYALPALIAVGQLIHERRRAANPAVRWLRNATVRPTLRRLKSIQPASGGFLEAAPLTGFVAMSLGATGRGGHAVCRRAVDFLAGSARPDGSWPIDTNLSNWLTSLATVSLAAGEGVPDPKATGRWLVGQQYRRPHPYTDSPPGGWAWTHLSGGVPDADDTAGALLALQVLRPAGWREAARRGVRWLLGLQNADGGWPTFCRGWGKLPFDRSAPDLTAHALRALTACAEAVHSRSTGKALKAGLGFLRRTQRPDGSWVPLWFGNQRAREHENPVYGTTRVLECYADLGRAGNPPASAGVRFLLGAQNWDGGWGGAPGLAGSLEETALALGALARMPWTAEVRQSCRAGGRWLAGRILAGGLEHPAPIGLYFARLWYSERLYPAIWSVGALGRLLAGSTRAEGRPGASTMSKGSRD